MRIGIDARFYGGSFGKGLGRYCEKLIQHLEQIDTENDYVIFLRQENWEEYKPQNPRFKKVLADVRWYSFAEQIKLPKIFNKEKLDLLHVPHFNVPFLYRGDFVVTVHDLIILHYPTRRASTLGPIMYWFKQSAYRWVISRAVRRAKHIFAVSKFTKQDILEYFHLPEERVSVTYEAVEPLTVCPDKGVLKKFSILSPYLLYVGNAYPHKNIEGLIKCFFEVKKLHPQLQLVLVGKPDYFYDRIQNFVQSNSLPRSRGVNGQQSNVVFPGRVSDAELAALYMNSKLFVFPSHYEGFGLPPLEAMLAGVPVLSSKESCMPEILGDAAIYFDPNNQVDFVNKLNSGILLSIEERERLITAGLEQVKKYSWEECARRTVTEYGKLRVKS